MTVDHADAASGTKVREPVYPAVEDWVTEYFLPMFRRTLGGEYRWCGQWWQHGEAISRLTALWHAWEVLRLQAGTGIGTWYRDYLDQQLPVLMGARGPFYQCTESAHREPHEAAATPAPGDWWDLADDVLLGLGMEELSEDAQGPGRDVAILGDGAEEPGTGGDEPGDSTEGRGAGARDPGERAEQPGGGADQPDPGGSGPGSGADGRGTVAGKPRERDGQPGAGAEHSGPDGEREGSEGSR